MGVYQDAAVDGRINSANVSGQSESSLQAASSWSTNQVGWMQVGSVVAGAALVGMLVGGREGLLPGVLVGVAGVALFGDVTWT